MNLNFLRGVFALLTMLTLASGAAAYWQWSQNVSGPTERAIIAWVPPKPNDNVAVSEASDVANYPESFARPIFSPTRRPFVPPPPEPVPEVETEPALMPVPEAAAPPDVTQILLKGVRLINEKQQALILSAVSPVAQWLSVGDEIAGFQLVEISDDQIILEAGQQKIEVKLYANRLEN
jgi:hypothetical protein